MTNDKSKKILILEKVLRQMAVLVLKKYKPQVVAITGSVGKTSTKEAIATVLDGKMRVRKTEKNYNNEIGLPLTIIGAESGESSLCGWLKVSFKWLWVVLMPTKYPEVMVLEMGADRPGDIQYLVDFVKPNIAVITDISWSHVEFFKDVEGVAKEKGTLVRELDEKGLAVLNVDNSHIAKINNQAKCNVISFGFSEVAEMKATDVNFSYDENSLDPKGLSFKLNFKGTSIPVRLSNILARHQIYAALAAAAVGTQFGINLVEIGQTLENFSPPYGRMNLLRGIKDTCIIDDTYNSSPTSAAAAMDTLQELHASSENFSRKIVVLGDMLELGSETEEKHKDIANKFLTIKGDLFFAVGERMRVAVSELEKNNFPSDSMFFFENPMEAGRKLQAVMQKGDLILVKGSQGMRMEKVVEEVMADPQNVEKLLCRQSEHWKEIPWKKV